MVHFICITPQHMTDLLLLLSELHSYAHTELHTDASVKTKIKVVT